MQFTTTTSAPIEIEIDSEPHELRRLTIDDFGTLASKLRAINVGRAAAQLNVLRNKGGISEDQLPMIVAEFTKEPAYVVVSRWIYTTAGARAALELAGFPAAAIDKVSPQALHELAHDVAFGMDEAEADGTVPNSQALGETAPTGAASSGASPTTTPDSATPVE